MTNYLSGYIKLFRYVDMILSKGTYLHVQYRFNYRKTN